MHRPLGADVLIPLGMLIICIITGCSSGDLAEHDETKLHATVGPQTTTGSFVSVPPATSVKVKPLGAGTIPTDTEFTLKFDQKVKAVWVNNIPACGSGDEWKVTPGLGPGDGQMLHIEWLNIMEDAGDALAGPYLVKGIQSQLPAITHGTVFDGESDVDPAPINIHGLRFDFNEAVRGTLKLTDEVGVSLDWIGIVRDKTAILVAVAGQELVHGTTYKIEIDLQDHSDQPLQTTITFVTRPK